MIYHVNCVSATEIILRVGDGEEEKEDGMRRWRRLKKRYEEGRRKESKAADTDLP